MTTPIYADIELVKGVERIVLFTLGPDGEQMETLWNDGYLIKEIPGKRWDTASKRWHLPLSWPSCVVLRAQFGDRLLAGETLASWSKDQRWHRENAMAVRDALRPPEGYQPINDHDELLYPFQIPGAEFLVRARNALLGDEMGSGKTFQTIAALRRVDMVPEEYQGGAYPALIVCPNTLKRNWEREIKRWLPEANPFVIHGSADKRRKQLAEAIEAPNAIIIMNIEAIKLHSRLSSYGSTALKKCAECDPKAGDPGLKVTACEVHPKELNSIPFRVCVLDEAHRCFPGDTQVLTDEGWVPISAVVDDARGTAMLSYSSNGEVEWKPITNRWRNPARELVTVKHQFGEFRCTADHKIWTSAGYREAGKLERGEILSALPEAVQTAQEDAEVLLSGMFVQGHEQQAGRKGQDCCGKFPRESKSHLRVVRPGVSGSSVLLGSSVLRSVVQLEVQARHDSEPDGEPRNGRKDENHAQSDWASAKGARRERHGFDRTATHTIGGVELANRSGGIDATDSQRDVLTSNPLQDRRRFDGAHDCGRSGRSIARRTNPKGAGCEERNRVVPSRVESVEVYQPASAGRSAEGTSGDSYLYDIEVADNHNYFAEGVLVSNCKDPNAQQTRAIWSVFHGPEVRYRWALTGTPIANHVGDFWSILHTLDPDAFPTKTAFLDRYAIKEFNHFGAMTIRGLNPKNKAEFETLVGPYMRRMLKAQVLPELPDKVFMRRDVPMSPKQAKAYNDIAKQLVTVLDDGSVLVADGSLAGATRLLQFASAYCEVKNTDEGGEPLPPEEWLVKLTDNPKSSKLDELMSIIEDNPGKPLVIAAEHRQLIDLAAARLGDAGIPHALVTGGITADERDAAVQAFQSGKIDLILFTYKAGGVGLNLTRADTMIRLQRPWSLVDYKQGEDRIHRIGSETHQSVTFIDLVAEGTIEESQIERLYQKAERLEEIVRDRAKLIAAGGNTDDLDAEGAYLWTSNVMEE